MKLRASKINPAIFLELTRDSSRCTTAIATAALGLSFAIVACSAGGGNSPTGEVVSSSGASGAQSQGTVSSSTSLPSPRSSAGPLLGIEASFGDLVAPQNVGSELLCDGVDENNNGIVDDVDIGLDGLCDCLRIGFLGDLASDAGNQTGAFEQWLEDRSDFEVTHFQANERLESSKLAGLQVVVVGNLKSRSDAGGFQGEEIQAIQQWVEAGGGLITLAGYTAREEDILATVQLLEPMGLGYDYEGRGPGVLGVGAPPVLVDTILAPEHPSMDGITTMGVYNAYPVVGDGEAIFGDGTFELAMAKPVGDGQVYVFSDEWITQDVLWVPGMAERPLSECQRNCAQCERECVACDEQCAACSMQPCQGGGLPAPGEMCARGCDQSCSSCSTRCDSCQEVCATCSAGEVAGELDIPRFWLNVMRFLTPENECQVPVPAVIR